MISRVRGTRDILDSGQIEALFTVMHQHFVAHNFSRIYTPLIEPLVLFKRSLGTETDVVSKEMFMVSSSSGQSDEEICLRPEATASTVRAFVENGIQVTPWKVFTIGEMFRYERPQKGRFRQFFQCSIEEIGSSAVVSDIAFITMLATLFTQKLGIADYTLHINYLGCPEDRVRFKQEMAVFLETRIDQICQICQKRKDTNILRVFDCKQEQCQLLYKNAPRLTGSLCATCVKEWQVVQSGLTKVGIAFMHAPCLVRGLDYYNKTVFEFTSSHLGAQAAFCGGGRYDHLVSAVGGKKDQPSIGAAIGVERVLMILEELSLNLVESKRPLFVLIPLSEEQHIAVLEIALLLRKAGLCVEMLCEGSLKSMMRKADALNARACLLFGSNEQAAGVVSVKDMVTGQATELNLSQLAPFLVQMV